MTDLTISIARDESARADNSAHYARLDAQIAAHVATMRLPSDLTTKRYSAALAEDHQAELAEVRESKALVGDDLFKLFVRLMALTGEPVVISADQKSDFLARIRASASPQATTQSIEGKKS